VAPFAKIDRIYQKFHRRQTPSVISIICVHWKNTENSAWFLSFSNDKTCFVSKNLDRLKAIGIENKAKTIPYNIKNLRTTCIWYSLTSKFCLAYRYRAISPLLSLKHRSMGVALKKVWESTQKNLPFIPGPTQEIVCHLFIYTTSEAVHSKFDQKDTSSSQVTVKKSVGTRFRAQKKCRNAVPTRSRPTTLLLRSYLCYHFVGILVCSASLF